MTIDFRDHAIRLDIDERDHRLGTCCPNPAPFSAIKANSLNLTVYLQESNDTKARLMAENH
jgi:hypothetical protein